MATEAVERTHPEQAGVGMSSRGQGGGVQPHEQAREVLPGTGTHGQRAEFKVRGIRLPGRTDVGRRGVGLMPLGAHHRGQLGKPGRAENAGPGGLVE